MRSKLPVAAFVIHEKDLSPNSLLRAINKIIDDEKLRGEMATQSRKLGRPGLLMNW